MNSLQYNLAAVQTIHPQCTRVVSGLTLAMAHVESVLGMQVIRNVDGLIQPLVLTSELLAFTTTTDGHTPNGPELCRLITSVWRQIADDKARANPRPTYPILLHTFVCIMYIYRYGLCSRMVTYVLFAFNHTRYVCNDDFHKHGRLTQPDWESNSLCSPANVIDCLLPFVKHVDHCQTCHLSWKAGHIPTIALVSVT